MKQKTINQEILLITGTSLSKKQLCENKDEANQGDLSFTEQLEKACWAGLLCEMIPGIINRNGQNYLWEVLPAEHFIRVAYGTAPVSLEKETSIDPYFFLSTLHIN